MKTEFLTESERSQDAAPVAEAAPSRTRKTKRRPPPAGARSEGAARFFLSQAESAGTPALDREFDSEAEVLVESLKTGRSYFVILEWKGLADLSQKTPLIRKEAVTRK